MKIKFHFKKKSQQHHAHAQQLREHCKQARTFIKKYSSRTVFNGSARPWILLLGTPQSGKTSLLRGASLPLTSPHQLSLDSIQPTQLVDWWINEKVGFIDPASDIILPSNAIESTRWETLLKIIHRYRMMRSLQQIILVIDLPSLLTLKTDTLDQLSTQLQCVQEITKRIPVSIVISKCDQLEGFSDMFDDMNAEERKQTFGITLTHKDHHNGLSTAFERAFTVLIQHLKARLLNRMHHEQNLEKRHRIFAFPAKFATLSQYLKELTTRLPFNSSIPLSGIYFTAIKAHRVYFIDSMIKTTVAVAKYPLPITQQYGLKRLLALPIAIIIIFGFTLLWHSGYNQTIHIANKVEKVLASTPSNTPHNLSWLSELNTISTVLGTIQQKRKFYYQWAKASLLQTYRLHKLSTKKYHDLLKTQFTLYIKSTLLNQIQQGMKNDKLALFDALKAYLSITQEKYYNKDSILNWYRTYWGAVYPTNKHLQATLQHHLCALLASKKLLWRPDSGFIQQAQAVLQKLSLTELAFLELQGEYEPTNVSIFPNGHLEGISLENATVPSFFSATHFKEIFSDKIPHIGKILAKENWVLGTTSGRVISPKQQADIAKKIQMMYLQYYTNAWASTLTNIQLQPATHYSDVLQRMNSVLDSKSNLWALLKVVVGQASLNRKSSSKNVIIIKTYLDKKGRYQSIQKTLTSLKNEIQGIQNARNSNKASYLHASNRFKHDGLNDPIGHTFAEASKNPEPIRSWLNTIALSSWKIMLSQTRSYVNTVWQTIVLPVYHHQIEHRYPIFSDSRDDISLKNFTDFFGSNGVIGAYFIYYLQDFVNTTQNYWVWKRLNGVDLDIPQETLNTFIRASIIQQMFFTDNHHKPSFRFIVVPLTLSSDTKKFMLNLGGQRYNVYQTPQGTKQFFWPGPDPNVVSVQFVTNDGAHRLSTYHGPWSWFRMIDANRLKTTADPKQFAIILQSGNTSVSLKVIATHRVNPMVPGVIEKYRCPNQL